MPSTPQTDTDPRKLLFISYAYEDQVFAKWLARKLAFKICRIGGFQAQFESFIRHSAQGQYGWRQYEFV